MKVKKKYRKKRFTLHDVAIELIRSKVHGVDAHHNAISIGNCIPDVLTEDTAHEVVAINIRSKNNKLIANKSVYHHILWLALPSNSSLAFEKINVVEVKQKGFKALDAQQVTLETIVLPQPNFRFGKRLPKNKGPSYLEEVENKLSHLGFIQQAETFKFVREKFLPHFA